MSALIFRFLFIKKSKIGFRRIRDFDEVKKEDAAIDPKPSHLPKQG